MRTVYHGGSRDRQHFICATARRFAGYASGPAGRPPSMADSEDAAGVGAADSAADAAGNVIVIELDSGLFVVLAHLQHGSLQVSNGDAVRKGDALARVGNSGNTTMPHLHLQVQTHMDLWDPDNRSVPFAFDTNGRVPVRNDRIVL